MARLLTSSATTANPAPASPALAASTAAFNASRFVWKAISSMVLTIFWVFSLAEEMSAMDSISSFIELSAVSMDSLASPMIISACLAFSAFCLVREDISSNDEDVSSRVAACSDAPSARDWLDSEICPAAPLTWLDEADISLTTPLNRLMMPRAVNAARIIPRRNVIAPTIATCIRVAVAADSIISSVMIFFFTVSFALARIS